MENKIDQTMIINDMEYENCPLCSSDRLFKVGNISYKTPLYFSTTLIKLASIPELWSCKQCLSSFTQNRIPEKAAVTLYSHGESIERWSSERIPFNNLKPINQIECLQRYLILDKKVLDIGCNTGELLDYAKSFGCETAGIEYSQQSREILKNKNHTTFTSISEVSEQFDVITAFDLVEHLYNIPDFFLICKEILKKDGVLIILTGNIECLSARLCKSNWWYFRYPEHIVFPSKEYFDQYSGFNVDEWSLTFASKDYRCSWLRILREGMSRVLRSCYNGLPSIGPDHVLAVLKSEA